MIAYVAPDLYRDIIQSLITRMADQAASGSSDVFKPVQGVPNVRYERSPVIVADALSKGYTGFDRLAQAYPVLRDLTGYYSGQQLRQGFIADRPGDMVQRGYDQWALAIIADAVGRTNDTATLRKQALLPIANQYQPGAWTAADGTPVALLTPRNSNGAWTEIDHEKFESANLYQGTPWQYNWYPAYDMAGLIKATGGRHAAEQALRHLFGEDDPDNGHAMLHSNANEIDLQAPYLFNYVNQPALTQKWVRAIYTQETWNRYIATGRTDGNQPPSNGGEFTPPIRTKVYQLAPEGFLPTMDNDVGTMSTMFVAAALGLFPVTAGSSQYQIGTPFFDAATISYPTGRTFTVSARNVSPDDFYVQTARLNGRGFGNTWIDFGTITAGGTLDFTMGAAPSQWGADSAPAYSLSNPPGNDDPHTYKVTADRTTLVAGADGKLAAASTLTFPRPVKLAAPVGTDLVRAGSARVVGLLNGVAAAVTVSGASTVSVRVNGTLSAEAQVWIEFTDAAFKGGVKARQLTGQAIAPTSPITLSMAAVDRAALGKLVGDALLERQGNYSVTSYRAFTAALARAKAVLDDPAAAGADLRAAKEYLQSVADSLTLSEGGYRVLQGEESDDWSGPPLNNQAYMSAGNLGGVTDGSWIRYLDLDFTGTTPKYLLVHYASYRAPDTPPAGLQVHAGDKDGPVVGTAALPGTGGWGNYQTIVVELTNPSALVEAKSVSFTFSTPPGEEWVSNFDWFQFTQSLQSDPNAPYVLEAESWTGNGGNLKNESNTWASGPVANVGGINDGSWLDYTTVDFGAVPVTDISVHYVNNTARCGTDSRLDVYVDAANPANPGTPFVTVPLPATGDNWTADGTTSIALPTALTGRHRLTIVNRSTTDAGHPYVANLDSFTFTRAPQNALDVQAETWQSNSGDPLKVENSNWNDGPVVNVGATYDRAWIDYGTVDFGSTGRNQVSVHYTGNSGRVGSNPRLEFHLDASDPAQPGEPIATVALPATGADWNTAGTGTATISTPVTGSHRLSVVMRANTSASLPYVANLDKYTFSTEQPPATVDKSRLTQAIATAAPYLANLGRYLPIAAAVLQREYDAAQALLTDEGATQSQVDAQTRSLLLATSQLLSKPRRELEALVAAAESRTNQRYTDASWQTLQSAIAQAEQVLADTASTDAALTQQRQRLQVAIDSLQTKAKTAPSIPLNVAAGGQDSALTVSWQAPADDGGSAVTGYLVRLDDGHELRVDDPEQHVVTFSWLTAGRKYAASVRAINAIGTSPGSPWTAPYTAASSPTATTASTASTATKAQADGQVRLADDYPSDAWPTDQYLQNLLGAFPKLPETIRSTTTRVDRDQVVAANDKVALAINNAATTAEMNRAQVDADHPLRETGSDALGSRLGPIYREALAAGELPQTKAVLDRVGQRIPGADAAKGFWPYDRPFLRLGLASKGGLIMDSPAGGYDGYAGSPSFPSGHTYGGYIEHTTLATLLPELAPTILARASEYGNNRIVNGFHYPLDVMGGRMIAQSVVAHRWADPEFAPALELAHKEIESVLAARCEAAGYATLKLCAGDPYAGLSDAAATQLYTYRLDYGFPRVGPVGRPEVVPTEAAELLTSTFPELTDAQRADILRQTALDSGTGLDRTAEGADSWLRINLSKAMTATYRINADGSVTVTNYDDTTAGSVSTLSRITVNGTPIDGFDPATRTYMVDWCGVPPRPRVGGVPAIAGATTKVSTSPGSDRTVITVTSANRRSTTTYAVELHRCR